MEVKEGFVGKKSKFIRDRDRDISEKMVLGMVNIGVVGGEFIYD